MVCFKFVLVPLLVILVFCTSSNCSPNNRNPQFDSSKRASIFDSLFEYVGIGSGPSNSSASSTCKSYGPRIKTSAEIIETRGFVAEKHKIITSDGYILTVTRLLNPKFNGGKSGLRNRRPILFVHGEYLTGAAFIAFSDGIEPKDCRNIDEKSLENDPISKSLPFLASCYGHEAWILDRRGCPESLGHIRYQAFKCGASQVVGQVANQTDAADCSETASKDPYNDLAKVLNDYEKSAIDRRYWNYSQDNHAHIDLPDTTNYILAITQQDKLAIVAESSGGAITLMHLSDTPDFADKISSAVLLSPALYLAPLNQPFAQTLLPIVPILTRYSGPISNLQLSTRLTCLVLQTCLAGNSYQNCIFSLKAKSGEIGNNQTGVDRVDEVSGILVSSFQQTQLMQERFKGRMHHFDFGNTEINQRLYGQSEPPMYDVSRIKLRKISLFHGKHDINVPPEQIELLISDMKVPVKRYYYNQTGLFFEHQSVLYHELVGQLVNLPALRDIQESM